jgi:hypothetical protein
MGLFSGSKKVYVSSVVYNMAGDITERPKYMKSLVMSNVISTMRFNFSQTIRDGYLSGPGLRLRRFQRWANDENNWDQIGAPWAGYTTHTINIAAIRDELVARFGVPAGVSINWVDTGLADIVYWGRQKIAADHPALAANAYDVDYDITSNTARIHFTGGTPADIVFTPVGFDASKHYLYVNYSLPTGSGFYDRPLMFMYQYGTSPILPGPVANPLYSAVLENQFRIDLIGGGIMPFIPIRIDNKFLGEGFRPAAYEQAKKGYKKAIGGKLDDLIEQIEDNENLDDIDYAFIVFGVPLNTEDNLGRQYIYKYLKRLIDYQTTNETTFDTWLNDTTTNYTPGSELNTKWAEIGDETAGGGRTPPPGGPPTPAPPRPPLSFVPRSSIIMQAPISSPFRNDLKLEIQWQSTEEEFFDGVGKPGVVAGDVWWTINDDQVIDLVGYGDGFFDSLVFNNLRLWYQLDSGHYSRLNLKGLKFRNTIYQGKTEEISAKDALTDPDESGFLIPINSGVFAEFSLVNQTELSMNNTFLLFNCYQVVKQPWYASGFFKIILVVAVIVITALSGGLGAGTVGLLGANAVVGAAIGFTGLAAVIAGAVANMVAAMIVTKLIGMVATAILPPEIAMIVAAIASFAAVGLGSGMMGGQSLAASWGNLMSAGNILNATNAVGSGFAGMFQNQTLEMQRRTQDLMEDYNRQSLEIRRQYRDVLGYGTLQFDPMSLIEKSEQYFAETIDSFLSRTLMTGSDVAEMSFTALSEFPRLSLDPTVS